MKIITWNCNMSFRTKAEFILKENPDILIIPECENKERLNFGLYTKQPNDMIWFGTNPNKGIGVFSYCDYKFELLEIHNPEFKFILPILVKNNQQEFLLFAIWAQKPITSENYVSQIWNAVNYYSSLLDNKNVILAGDFNSNSIWDRPRRIATHTNLVNFLKEKSILSAYHHFHNQEQGKEKHMTLFMQRKIDRPYHIDYCFASIDFIEKLKHVEIGTYENWTKHSDHKPLTTIFEF